MTARTSELTIMPRILSALNEMQKSRRGIDSVFPNFTICPDSSGTVYMGGEVAFSFQGFDENPENPDDFFTRYAEWKEKQSAG